MQNEVLVPAVDQPIPDIYTYLHIVRHIIMIFALLNATVCPWPTNVSPITPPTLSSMHPVVGTHHTITPPPLSEEGGETG